MSVLALDGLDGGNPMGFLAALGALAALPGDAALSWSVSVLPTAVLHTDLDHQGVVAAVLVDRDRVLDSVAVRFPDPQASITDVKFADPAQTRAYLGAAAHAEDDGLSEAIAACLVPEVSLDNSGQAKPTDLHFTAGQQKFLDMVRALGASVSAAHLEEAMVGPWRYAHKMPSFMWDISDDRLYALSAVDPAGDKKRTVPGADWLAFRGLALLPSIGMIGRFGRAGRTLTPGGAGSWKSGSWSWPLWDVPIHRGTVQLLLGQIPRRRLDDTARPWTAPVGVFRAFTSDVTRSDQGGSGTMRPPRIVWERPVVH
jgi:hypothetical protein